MLSFAALKLTLQKLYGLILISPKEKGFMECNVILVNLKSIEHGKSGNHIWS
jgi:hypothetical protein